MVLLEGPELERALSFRFSSDWLRFMREKSQLMDMTLEILDYIFFVSPLASYLNRHSFFKEQSERILILSTRRQMPKSIRSLRRSNWLNMSILYSKRFRLK